MRRLGCLLMMLAPVVCSAQVSGVFSLEKTTFAPGEPVVLSLTLHNDGTEPEEVITADPYSFCSGYTIHIARDSEHEPACYRNFGGSCLSGGVLLAAGASRTERILLNYRNESKGSLSSPVKIPGDYTIDAKKGIAYGPAGILSTPNAAQSDEVRQIFHIRVDDSVKLRPDAYSIYVQQLNSTDDDVRREAARTLATMAPPALEPLLLSFASSKDSVLREFAPLALSNLGTKESLTSLAHFLIGAQPGTYESMTAANELGKTHDPAWLPLLLEVANQHGGMYLSYAAESGGDAAVPELLVRLRSPDNDARSSAIYALGRTGSRAAIPLLISLIRPEAGNRDSSALNEAIAADAALTQLTHLFTDFSSTGNSAATYQRRWDRWWLSAGATAPIYKPEECVVDTPLP